MVDREPLFWNKLLNFLETQESPSQEKQGEEPSKSSETDDQSKDEKAADKDQSESPENDETGSVKGVDNEEDTEKKKEEEEELKLSQMRMN